VVAIKQGSGGQYQSPRRESEMWTMLSRNLERQLVGQSSELIGGTRMKLLPAGDSDVTSLLCTYTVWHYMWDASGGLNTPAVTPKICGNHSSNTIWFLWPIDRLDSNQLLEQTRLLWQQRQSGGIEMQALAYNSKANAYMLHKVAVRARYEGLSETSDEVLSFDAQPLWLSPSEDFKAGRGLPLILDVFC